MCFLLFFFFVKQKTAYELRISDWSSDVCSSDLVVDADRHRLSARIDARDGVAQTEEVALSGIVDRIGAGDAFAAGVLHALLLGEDIEHAAAAGLALTCLKHSLPGDASLFSRADLDAFTASGVDVRREARRSEERRVGKAWVRPCRARW